MDTFFKTEPQIIAHNYLSKNCPPNTIESYKAAIEAGADAVHLRLWLSSDGVPVISSTDDLALVSDGNGPISSTDFNTISNLDAGAPYKDSKGNRQFAKSGYRLSSLSHTLNACPNVLFVISIMTVDAKVVKEVCELIIKEDAVTRVLLNCQNEAGKRIVRESYPGIALALSPIGILGTYALFRMGLLNFKKYFTCDVLMSPEFIGPSFIANPGLIRKVQEKGIKVYIMDVNTEEQFQRLRSHGVDAFVTNNPPQLKKWIDKEQLP